MSLMKNAIQYIIINSTSYLIAFLSTGILDLLFPIKARSPAVPLSPHYPAPSAVGTDIFKFLANHSPSGSSLGSDFKAAVRSSLKLGNPISLDLKLCARPYMGFERFVLHWTPLKDEQGVVCWVVLTLGNEARVGLAY